MEGQVMAQRVVSLLCNNTSAIGGIADSVSRSPGRFMGSRPNFT